MAVLVMWRQRSCKACEVADTGLGNRSEVREPGILLLHWADNRWQVQARHSRPRHHRLFHAAVSLLTAHVIVLNASRRTARPSLFRNSLQAVPPKSGCITAAAAVHLETAGMVAGTHR